MTACCFCAELAGVETEFHDLYPDLSGRIVAQTERFVVLPSLGQLAPGHLLLLPREHVTSFGALNKGARQEAQRLCLHISRMLDERFSTPVCFEHGSSGNGHAGGCGITHAHVHFVPAQNRRVRTPPSVGSGWRQLACSAWLDEAAALAAQRVSYLLWHPPGELPLLEIASNLQSQYLRRYVAAALGHPRWDWRRAGSQPELRELLTGATRSERLFAAR